MNQSNGATSGRAHSPEAMFQTPQKPEKSIWLQRLFLLLLLVGGFILFIMLNAFVLNSVVNSIIQPRLDSFYDFIHQRWVLIVIGVLLGVLLFFRELGSPRGTKYETARVMCCFNP